MDSLRETTKIRICSLGEKHYMKDSLTANMLAPLKKINFRSKPLEAEIRAPTKSQIAIWGIILVLGICFYSFNYQSFQIGSWQDDRLYAVLAKSMVSSDMYGIISVPGDEPFSAPYPFGYPLVIAPMLLFFPENIDVLKIPSLIATILNLSILFWAWPYLSRRSYWWGLAVIAVYAIQPQTVWHTRLVMSEPIFISFYLGAIIIAEQAVRGKWNWWRRVLFSIMVVFTIFTRIIGVFIMAGIIIYMLIVDFRKFRRDVLILPIIIIFIISLIVAATPVSVSNLLPERYFQEGISPSILRFFGIQSPLVDRNELLPARYIHPSPEDTVEAEQPIPNGPIGFIQIMKYKIMQNFGVDIRQVIFPLGGGDREKAFTEIFGLPFLPLLIGYLISGVIIVGLIQWFHLEGVSAFFLSTITYLVPLVIWFFIGPRFFYPIQAQLIYAFFIGIELIGVWLLSLLSQNWPIENVSKVFVLLSVIVLGFVFGYKSLTLEDTRMHLGDFKTRTEWIKKLDIGSSAIIMTEQPILDYVYGGRKTMPYPDSNLLLDNLTEYINLYGIDYVLIAPKIRWLPRYIPSYSDEATQALTALRELASHNQITLIYQSKEDWISVYKVER